MWVESEKGGKELEFEGEENMNIVCKSKNE